MNPNGQDLRREWHPHYLTLENQLRVIIAKRRNWKKKKMIDAINNCKILKLRNHPILHKKNTSEPPQSTKPALWAEKLPDLGDKL